MSARFHCPLCGQPVKREAEDFPFCSSRCRLIDLGHWVAGDYVLSEPDAARDRRAQRD
ncbi:MAG: DNA gyrase inhibitor YacG [Zetaproteobacteria bacterium]|nr:MAG: DNA gyrase inhibitor YacG [Zetaproteobacteria bacterium]